MAIEFKNNIFHIYNDQISYVMGVLKNGHIGHFYLGKKIEGPFLDVYFRRDQNKGLTSNVFENNPSFSLSHERLEYPIYGTTDFREGAFELRDEKDSHIFDFTFDSYQVLDEKPMISLPMTRYGQSETLLIHLRDAKNLRLTLSYTIFDNLAMIAKSSRMENLGKENIRLERLMSSSFDLPDSEWEMIQFSGDWAREREIYQSKLRPGIQSIFSLRGASSAQHNPSLILKRQHTTEDHGEAIGIALIYSGNFMIQNEVDSNHTTRVMAGIHPQHFSWNLEPKECFQSPECLITYTSKGLNDLSHTFHKTVNNHIVDQKWQERPIVLNNWEATYFDFTEEKIVELAREGKSLGIEMFVLDDGWFGQRNSDQIGLGDWYVNLKKLPNGIQGLSKKIHAMDMKFGLWIEPEMVNKGSELYQEHPDWLIGDPERKISHGRNQYVLDFSQEVVVNHIFNQLTQVLDGAEVDYIKWDMNKNITQAYSPFLKDQGELFHRYIVGVYKLYEKLQKRYPHILFESCASGGGRFDLGMMYYAPQAWTSDNTDAVERLKIQHANSMIYPLATMASHVSAVPNHQVKRMTSLEMRGHVANFGTFGYELDVTILSDDEKKEIIEQVKTFKNLRTLMHTGDFYRLLSPFEGNNTAWQVVSEDREEVYVAWFQTLAKPNEPLRFLKLKGLDPLKYYQVPTYDQALSGSFLMEQGLIIQTGFNGVEELKHPKGDYQSRTWYIRAV